MVRGAFGLVLFAACSFEGAAVQPPTNIDAGDSRDAAVAASCEDWAVLAYFDPCQIPEPIGELVLDSGKYTIDTDSGILMDSAGGFIAHAGAPVDEANQAAPYVLSVSRFELAPTMALRAQGNRPLIIASWSKLSVDGTIDVSSGEVPGAGAETRTNCVAAEPGTDDIAGAGGGGGGAFGGAGARGGNGNNNANAGGDGGTAIDAPNDLAGGCPGLRGGNGDNGMGAGVAGLGGGALALAAFGDIAIAGRVVAGGQGGAQGTNGDAGGGGGGSGGLIALLGSSVTIGGEVVANGGGGGAGAGDTQFGTPGGNGNTVARAVGGTGSGGGRDGGEGSGDGDVAGEPGGDAEGGGSDGGGGGGAGAGFILVWGDPHSGNGVTSPAVVAKP